MALATHPERFSDSLSDALSDADSASHFATSADAACNTLSDTLPTDPEDPGTMSRSPVGQPATSAQPARAAQPGLSARMASLHSGLTSLLADLDPGLLTGNDAAALYADFCRLDRMVTAGRTILAPRIADSGHWRDEGHRSPASLLATLEGGSAGSARRTLEAGQRLVHLPGTEDALRKGTLSGPKLEQITQAASLDPDSEELLLAGSASDPLHVVKERCQKVRTTAAGRDPGATLARIHKDRSFTTWTDSDGAFCYQGRDTAERGARLMAHLVPVANRLRDDRRAAAAVGTTGRPTAGGPTPMEPETAVRADALFLLATGGDLFDPCTGRTTGGEEEPPAPEGGAGMTPTPGRSRQLLPTAPPATVIVRVDLGALRRGNALPGELSEIEGHGPVPVPVVQSLVDDAFLACVFVEAGDIRAVAHLGRTINQKLRTALALRDRRCVVPGCGVGYSLEIDHVLPLESGGDTRLDNLALLCSHHHRMKTYEGWVLARGGPTDEEPRWTFTPLPPFGQEPDLGHDRRPQDGLTG